MNRTVSTMDGHARQIDDGTLYMQSMGRAVQITAIASSVSAANAYMAQHPGEGIMTELGPFVLIARVADLGEKATLAGTLADDAVALAKRIDDALKPEIAAARLALTDIASNFGQKASLRAIARTLKDALSR